MLRQLSVVALLLVAIPVLAVDHPALYTRLDQTQVDSLRKAVDPVLNLSEADMLKLIPTQSGLYFVGCVNCKAGMQEGQLTEWDVKNPDQVKCRFCGQVYPSDKYPVTGVTEVKAPNGAIAQYPYYESRPSWWTGQEPYRSYFGARIDYHKIRYMESAARSLARLYKLTGDETYGRRAALILTRFAQVYPGYCYHFDFPFAQKVIYDGPVVPKDFRAGFRTARWTWWAYLDASEPLLEAYDLLAGTGQLEKVGQEQQVDAPALTEAMFTAMADQLLGNQDDLGNMSPGMWADLIRVGRVLGKPEYVHTAIGRLRRMVTELFFYDGSWQEGAPSYHSQVVGNFSGLFAAARGYSDPAGYKDPQTGERFDNLELDKSLPEVGRAQAALDRIRLPNGRRLPVHDTWSTDKSTALQESKPELLGGLGQAILGRGQGADQMQVDLTWSPGYGHIHYDGLSLLVFAKGKELLSDLGYTHTKSREWTLQSASHNLVVVDNANQEATKDTQGYLRYMATGGNVQIVSVDNPQVYADVKTYRRTVAMVGLDAANAYVVDAFEVEGGKQHDYFLHGSADDPQTLAVNMAGQQIEAGLVKTLVPEGVVLKQAQSEQESNMGVGQAYGYLHDLKTAHCGGQALVKLDYANTEPGAGLQVYTVAQAGDDLYLGTNPAIRGAGSDDSKLDQYKRQFMMLRRTGGASLFTSIMVPYGDTSPVDEVKLVDLPGAQAAFEVHSGDRQDLVIIKANGASGVWNGKPVLADTEFGVITLRGGVPAGGTAVAGQIAWNGFVVKAEPMQEHALLAVKRDPGGSTLTVAGEFLPPAGTIIAVDHGGQRVSPYTVTASARVGDNSTLTIAEDAGFEFDPATSTSTFVFLPRASYAGPHAVRLYPVAEVAAQ